MKALVELALAVHEGQKNSNVSPVVKKALEKHQAEQEERASNDIVSLLRQIEERKLQTRAEIRKMKARLNGAVKELDELDRSWAYAQATNNFLPVLAFFGQVHPTDLASPEDFAKLTKVPDTFVVPTDETKEAK